jgi:putative transcriptional regulator
MTNARVMEKITDLLHITYNKVLPQKGKVLVSQPFMSDGCFKRSVVLLTEYSEACAIGFVLNKSLHVRLGEVMDDFPAEDSILSIGGPVSANTLHYLHTFPNIPDAVEVVNGIYWGGHIDVIRKLLSTLIMKPEDIRFFLGYSGWSEGQLDEELKNDSWLVGDIRPKYIINPSADLWRESVKNMGDEYKLWVTFPENPGFN